MAPMKFRLTSPYGAMEEIRDGRPHTGIDLAMPEGTTLRSVADGIVERVTELGSLGKGVIIHTEDGLHFVYGHMSKVSVKVGQQVDAGQLIGLSGNTGHSTGPHLHFGMARHGEWIDPTPLADTIAEMSGGPDRAWWDIRGKIADQISESIDGAKEAAKEAVQEQIYIFLQAAGEVVLELTYAVTLIGCAALIILKVAGYKDGYRHAGVLFVVNVMLRLVMGGAMQ